MFSDESMLMTGNESGDATNSTCSSHNDHNGSPLRLRSHGVGRVSLTAKTDRIFIE